MVIMKKSHIRNITIIMLIAATSAFFAYDNDTPLEKVAKHIKRGDVLFERGEFKKARLEYKNAAKITPTDVEIEYRWGLVDEAEGDVRAALAAFMQAEQQDPHFHKAKIKVAHYHLIGNSLEEAQKRINAILTDDPQNIEAHALNSALFLRKKDFVNTEKEARFALSKDPANITATSVLTGMYLEQGQKDKAEQILTEGIKRNPKDTSLLMLKGKIYETPLNIEKINETYNEIFKLKPKDIGIRIYLANIYIGAQKIDEAETVLRKAVDDIENSWEIKQELVNFLAKNRDIEIVEKQIHAYMQQYPDNKEIYLWLADIYLKKNNTEKAIDLLKQIIAEENDDKYSLNAKTSLAKIDFAKGDKETARKIVEAVLKKSPKNPKALLVRANIFSSQGDYQLAVSDLRAIIHSQPKATEALSMLAEVLLLQGYNDLAIETMNQLIDIEPANTSALVRLSQLYNLNGNNQQALKISASVNKVAPGYSIGWENTARIAISMKDFETAHFAIKNLTKIEGHDLTAAFLEGQISAGNDNSKEAISYYTKVIDADPTSPLSEHALYSLVETHNNDNAALENITKYIASLKTDSAYVNTILGECYIKLGKKDLAASAFDKAIANNPSNQSAYIHRARIYAEQKNNEKAIEILKIAADKIPTDVRALMLEADILRVSGKYREAVELYENILKNNPKIDAASNNMAAIIADHEYEKPEELEKAMRAVKQFADSENHLLLDTLGWVYYRQGKFEQALIMLERSLKINPKASPEIHYHYGAILWKNGNVAKAKEELIIATGNGNDFPSIENAKKILQELPK